MKQNLRTIFRLFEIAICSNLLMRPVKILHIKREMIIQIILIYKEQFILIILLV